MNKLVVYIHGKDGNAEEALHYKSFFPDCDVIGFNYKAQTPWEAKKEFRTFILQKHAQYTSIILIANSIGAYFAMSAEIGQMIQKAYFISPIVDMEKLICNMMLSVHITEDQLKKAGVIYTEFGETLSWEYLSYVREHPLRWNVPTEVLYGNKDFLTLPERIKSFAETYKAGLTIMKNGGHWFHTKEEMQFLEEWIKDKSDNQAGRLD